MIQSKQPLEPITVDGVTVKPRNGFYRCPYKCGHPDYPKPKWRTERGMRKHLAECHMRPSAVEDRRREQKAKDKAADEKKQRALAACKHKVGEVVAYTGYVVTKPTHKQRFNRMVRIRYEEGRSYFSAEGTILAIDWIPDALIYEMSDTGSFIRESDICEDLQAAKAQARMLQEGYDDHCEFASRCR